jgi:APA family basic amino acid/polyamine antiporter
METRPADAPAGRPGAGGSEVAATHFARRLGLFSAVMIVVSAIIGGGIFINPYLVAQIVRTPVLILAAWAAGGAIALAGAFVFAELSTVLPRVGGQYAFFREAFHPWVAFLQGWTLLLLVESGAVAAIAVTLAEYLVRLLHIDAPHIVPALAVAILVVLCGYHALGIRPGAILINVVTAGKTLVLVALVGGALIFGPRVSGLVLHPATPPEIGGFGLVTAFFAALVPVMFAYGGWQNLNYVAEEVIDPLRNLPRALLIGVLGVVVVYVSANIAYVHVLGAASLAATRTPAADAAAALWGEPGAALLSAVVVVSTFGFLNLALMAPPRVYYAMAADGLFFGSMARVSPRFKAPTAAILLQGGLAAALALTSTYERLLQFAVIGDSAFFVLTGVALLVFRRTLPDAPRPVPVPLYPWLPLAFIGAELALLVNLFVTDPRHALGGAAIVVAGVPVYFFWAWRRRPSGL